MKFYRGVRRVTSWLEFGGDPAEVVRFRVRVTAALAEVYAV